MAVPPALARAFGFILRADMAGTRTAPFRWGTADFLPECPLRHDSNHLLVDSIPPEVDTAALAGEAERLQGAAGLGHRCVMFRDAAAGERLATGFGALGWKPFRGAVINTEPDPKPPHSDPGRSLEPANPANSGRVRY